VLFRCSPHSTTRPQRVKPPPIWCQGSRWLGDLDDIVACYHAEDRHERRESVRFRPLTYEEIAKRDEANFDLFWLRDERLGTDALPPPEVLARSIVEDLLAALEQFAAIAGDLGGGEVAADDDK
jgi:hypothetical protein